MTTKHDDRPCTASEEFLRLPGLFRRWEFEQVIDGSDEFHIKSAGATDDGTETFSALVDVGSGTATFNLRMSATPDVVDGGSSPRSPRSAPARSS